MMKKFIYMFAVLLMLAACHNMRISDRLNQVDSLVVKEQYDSAYVLLNNLNGKAMTEDDQAHYRLLLTQLGFISNQPFSTDSLLNLALAYYKEVGNNEKLADAYYYKSYKLLTNKDFPQAIMYCKEAERLAMNSNNIRLKFKIAENLAYLNGLCDNDLMQLQYAKKALSLARKAQNRTWIAGSFSVISFAYANLGRYDSALIYVENSMPYIDYMYDNGKAQYLTNIGQLFKRHNTKTAKEYFEKALTYEELPGAIEHLGDIYYAEGNKEKAYSLWKKALTTSGGMGYEKDNLIHSILSYDLERGRLDETSKYVDEIIAIKDSIIYQLRNDTIKDLQLRFDHEVDMHEADKKLITSQRLIMGLIVILGMMAFYLFIRKKKEEALQKEHQMQLFAYTTEIDQLKSNKDEALLHIKELESNKDRYHQRISQLEEEARNAEDAIQRLNRDIKSLLNDKTSKLKKGKMLYDHIMEGKTAVNWSSKEEGLFNNYYAAINYRKYNQIIKVERTVKLSSHNLFYLILNEMGKSEDEIRAIMALSPEGFRTIKHRTKPVNSDEDSNEILS